MKGVFDVYDPGRYKPPPIDLSGLSHELQPLIRQLIDALRTLPGVGQKTAQRMALQLLERDRSGGLRLAQA